MNAFPFIPADIVWTVWGLRPQTWLIIIVALVIVLAVTRLILNRMKKNDRNNADEAPTKAPDAPGKDDES